MAILSFGAPLTSAVLNPPIVSETHAYSPYQKAAIIFQSDDLYSTLSYEEFVKALDALRRNGCRYGDLRAG